MGQEICTIHRDKRVEEEEEARLSPGVFYFSAESPSVFLH